MLANHAKIFAFDGFRHFDIISAIVWLEQRPKVGACPDNQEGISDLHLLRNDGAGRLPVARATR
jgi:hypothetical protein